MIGTAGTLRIQIAFQGGGAKLCDLLAAAEVIQAVLADSFEKT
jgi:hypothetical protein